MHRVLPPAPVCLAPYQTHAQSTSPGGFPDWFAIVRTGSCTIGDIRDPPEPNRAAASQAMMWHRTSFA
jgi:hypothetical protein